MKKEIMKKEIKNQETNLFREPRYFDPVQYNYPRCIARCKEISSDAKILWSLLLYYTDLKQKTSPSLEELEIESGLSKYKTQKALNELLTQKFVEKQKFSKSHILYLLIHHDCFYEVFFSIERR